MPYTKVDFTETIPMNTANLDQVETQYDEVLSDVGANMADSTEQLRCRVVSTFPTLSAGQIFYNSGTGKFYYSTTTAHVILAEKGQGQAVIS